MKPGNSAAYRVVRKATSRFFQHDGMVYSAAVAFNLLFSAIPVLFLVFAAASLVIGKADLPFTQLSEMLDDAFPYGAEVLVPILKELFASGATFGLVGTFLLLVYSFTATDAIQTSLAVMLGVPRKKEYLRSIVFHVAFVLSLTVLAFGAILVPPLIEGLYYLTRGMSTRLDEMFRALLSGVAAVVLAGVLFSGGFLSYRFLSPRAVRMRHALTGSAILLVLVYAIKGGYTFYLRKFSRLNIIYGSLFSVICFIIILYLFSAAYLFCASLIGVLEKEDGKKSLPEKENGVGAEAPRGD